MILVQPKANEFGDYSEYCSSNGFGFEVIDFMYPAVLDDKATTDRLQVLYKSAPVVSLHGPFIDINYSGGDSLVFKASVYRIEQCAEIAATLGAKKMVLHSCFFPLMPKDDILYKLWCEESAILFEKITKRYNITLCIENMLDKDPDIIEKMMNYNTANSLVRVCIDTGHANLSAVSPSLWAKRLLGYTTHYHINDNMGYYDEHLALGDGNIDWKAFFSSLPESGDADFVIELNNLDKIKRSIAFLKETGIFSKLFNSGKRGYGQVI